MPYNKISDYRIENWLPTSKKEVENRGWSELDVILFSGDAYIDHPSIGIAVIGRVLENEGLKVAIVPQPNWRDDLRDFKKLGKPRLFFGVSSGSMDSMMNHYTANLRLRSNDSYTPGGEAGYRPDYATTVYSNILKKLYPDTPIIIGGIEASLRRYTHYDYWSDKLKPSILIDSKADLLVYGMGEKSIKEIVQVLKINNDFRLLQNIPQTAYLSDKTEKDEEIIKLHSHEECLSNKLKFAENFKLIEEESNKRYAKKIVQQSNGKHIIVNPPYPYISEKEIDEVYDLPYTRLPHPRYNKKPAIPAFEMIKFSVNIHRGCFGGCSFCTISAHQGKEIVSRSEKSILKEVDTISNMPDFKGYISDIGGPSANMYRMKGINDNICIKCRRASCIFPGICQNLNTSHNPLLELYQKIRNHPKIKKAFIGSGIRYDLFLNNYSDASYRRYFEVLVMHHVSGRLKVAPEHTSDKVLQVMRKPSFSLFVKLNNEFKTICKREGLNLQLIPYFISSHPACTNIDMAELAAETKKLDFKLEQVQNFTPTAMTLASTMYYTGINPYTLKKIYVAKSKDEKQNQTKYFFWYKKDYQQSIRNELKKMNHDDLIAKLFKTSS